MKIQRLAHMPTEIVVPGDRYDELPPRPRMVITDADGKQVKNVDLAERAAYEAAGWVIEPGMTGMMALDGECLGINADLAVWRFGWTDQSRFAKAFGVQITCNDEVGYGFLWILATRKSGKIKETFRGWALNLPESFEKVVDAPILIESGEGQWAKITVKNIRK